MKAYTLLLKSILVLFIAKLTYGRIVLHEDSNFDKLAEVSSTVDLECDLTEKYGFNLNWRKIRGVRIDYFKSSFIFYTLIFNIFLIGIECER